LFNARLFNPIQERSFILMSAMQTLLPPKIETLNKNHFFTIRSFIGKPACGDQNIAVIFVVRCSRMRPSVRLAVCTSVRALSLGFSVPKFHSPILKYVAKYYS